MSASTGFDAVLAATPPDFDERAIIGIAARTFEVRASGARDLGSERDQTFLLLDGADAPIAVMKLSNAAEDPATLDMEALAVHHAARVDPDLPLALPWRVPGAVGEAASAFRATYAHADGAHHIRLYDVLAGHQRTDPRHLSDAALGHWGEMAARLARALRGFFHPAAHRTMLWDIQHAAQTRGMLGAIRDPARRDLVARVLDRYDEAVTPVWGSLRAQVVHGDLTTDNALVDGDGRITGIIDFGDMSHSALLIDIASLLDSLLNDRHGDELFRVARLVLDGYQRQTPLEELELRILGEAIAARAAVTIAISSWRSDRGLEDAAFAERYNGAVARTMSTLLETGWDEVARRFGAQVPRATGPGGRAALAARREAVLGPAIEPLTYGVPLHLVAASGVWMTDVDGRRYLDAYNNVPCVGHSHPRVAEAIARQARRLNTNLRYLHEDAIDLAERLVATMPAEAGLDTVFFVNSGSEANDLAWRLARTVTGRRGGVCTDFAYHGISDAIAPFSPESWHVGEAPEHIETWRPADADGVAGAMRRLDARGLPAAAVILDGVLTSDGYPAVSRETAGRWLADAHAGGAMWIADEVQGGHGRTGDAMWSFGHLGLRPDIVTIGKPMGNGHPVGAVITRRDIAAAFSEETVFFSTFGGNPVAAAAATAVLDVIADERVLERTSIAGAALRDAIRDVARDHPGQVTEVRGVGLAIGVAFASAAATVAVKEGLRERGVLVGTCGREGDVLKVRPPLAFTPAEVPVVADALAATLADVAISRGPS